MQTIIINFTHTHLHKHASPNGGVVTKLSQKNKLVYTIQQYYINISNIKIKK